MASNVENGDGARDVGRRDVLAGGVAGAGFGAVLLARRATAQTSETAAAPAAPPYVPPYVPKPAPTKYIFKIAETELNPDGEKTVAGIAVNGLFPGPEIRMTEGDMFRAQVENHLENEDTSLHWHGLLVPAVMDGVPDVAHKAIPPKQIQVFEFPLRQSGTYWYHSHSGLQEQVGFAGPLIIEANDEIVDYDREHTILLSDWLHDDVETVFEELKQGEEVPADMPMAPDLSDVKYPSFLMNGRGNRTTWTGMVAAGERVRLRIIGAGASTLFRVMVAEHKMTLSHVDGLAVQPLEIDNLLIGMGETYDVVVTIQRPGAFTIHAMAQDGSGQAIGVLHTADAEPVADFSIPQWGPAALRYADIRSLEPTPLPDGPLREIKMTLTGNMARYEWGIDNQLYPNAEPYFIKEGERVRVVMENATNMWHPMHLHGHFFRLLARDTDVDLLPLKHTVNIGPKETLAFEFFADNPGSWIFHCHNLYHLDSGMARVFIYQI
jgi:FtsP/CotA-like multicopper oxidase with cupredoxin domain